MEPNDFRGESSSSSVSAKKKLRKTKCHQSPKPFAKRYKYAKICTERCERILRFFKHQSRLTGIPVTNLVSQSLSRRQVRIESLHEMTGNDTKIEATLDDVVFDFNGLFLCRLGRLFSFNWRAWPTIQIQMSPSACCLM